MKLINYVCKRNLALKNFILKNRVCLATNDMIFHVIVKVYGNDICNA